VVPISDEPPIDRNTMMTHTAGLRRDRGGAVGGGGPGAAQAAAGAAAPAGAIDGHDQVRAGRWVVRRAVPCMRVWLMDCRRGGRGVKAHSYSSRSSMQLLSSLKPTSFHTHLKPPHHITHPMRREYLYNYYVSLGDGEEDARAAGGGGKAAETDGARQRSRLAAFLTAVGVDAEDAELARRKRLGEVGLLRVPWSLRAVLA